MIPGPSVVYPEGSKPVLECYGGAVSDCYQQKCNFKCGDGTEVGQEGFKILHFNYGVWKVNIFIFNLSVDS